MKQHINGAKWWKFDFHNHTPKSFDYGRGNVIEKDISSKEWLLKYMAKDIDCIAITDHNTGAFIDEVKKTYSELKTERPEGFKELFIFPGVELTVNGGIHIVAIFDPSKTSEDIAQIIGECKYQGTSGDSDGVTTETLESVINIINKKNGIAIPAHVDENAGLFKQQSGPTLDQTLKFNKDNLLALEVMNKEFEFPDIYNQTKLNLAKVVGSDSHTIDEIGRYFTWVKMSKPSIAALKLALHDGEDGVLRYDETDINPNNISHRYFIKSLTVSNGYKAGNRIPLVSNFSPWLTSIIGGRGTGKSSIVNYLRIIFDRVNDMPDEIQSDFNKFNRVGKKSETGMLRENTCITAEIIKDGKVHKIQWENNKHTIQIWNSEEQSWSNPNIITNIRELFPIQVFNQKELYSLTNNPSKLIELIDSQFDKVMWNDEKKELVSTWLAKRVEKRNLEEVILEEENIKASLTAVTNKIELFESSEYKETLRKFNNYTKVNNSIETLADGIENFISHLTEMNSSFPPIIQTEEINGILDETTLTYINELSKNFERVSTKISEALQIVEPYKSKILSNLNDLPWYSEFMQSKEAYDGITEQVKELGTDSYEELIKKRNSLNEKLLKISSQKEELKAVNENLEILYNSIIDKEKELRSKRNEILNRWKTSNNGTPILSIELDPMADVDNANSTFRKLLRKEGNEYAQYILTYNDSNVPDKGLIANIINEPSTSRWSRRESEIVEFISCTEVDSKSMDRRLAKHLDSLKSTTPEDIDRLLIWVPEDKLNLKFNKHGSMVNIETGSAGKRTAGMLGLLLALNTSPLVIDQPEDDLDTSLISNFVVTGFKTLKKDRQLVVVTHNPNIAVNANSDNIVHMNYTSGQITVSANDALQDIEIRNAVCDVMEGGKIALDKRYYRISKALK